jgi:nicotinate-nucleotide adenylyltransferase
VALADAARTQLALDRVVFVPAGDPWRKRDRAVSPAQARLAMLHAAVAGLAWAEVSTVDIDRAGPSYTADTLADLVRPGERWWFIIGADAMADMAHWHEPARIIEQARLAVAYRPGVEPAAVSQELRSAMPGIEERLDRLEMPPMEIASTDIRARIRDGLPTEGLLSPAVRAVVDRLGLYSAG